MHASTITIEDEMYGVIKIKVTYPAQLQCYSWPGTERNTWTATLYIHQHLQFVVEHCMHLRLP